MQPFCLKGWYGIAKDNKYELPYLATTARHCIILIS